MSRPANETPADELTTVRCKVCKEEIKSGATICKICKGYQDWRGSLNLSGAVLGLLVALVSVLGFTAPIFKDLLTPRNSKLEVIGEPKVISDPHGQSEIRLVVRNDGVRTGIFDHADAIITKNVITTKDNLVLATMSMQQIISPGQIDAGLVPSGATKEVRLIPDDRTKETFGLFEVAVDKKCNLHIFFIEFDGTSHESKPYPIGCKQLVGKDKWEYH